jgi:hypothetical protein
MKELPFRGEGTIGLTMVLVPNNPRKSGLYPPLLNGSITHTFSKVFNPVFAEVDV